MKNKEVKQIVLKISEGLLATATDLLLFQFFLLGASMGKGKTSRGAYQAIREAEEELEGLNYQKLKQTFVDLKRRGLIRSLKEPEITASGRKRLQSFLPRYQKERPWDKVIYLITYDIAEKRHIWRDRLREFINKIGAGRLQNSVWLTPFNPQKLLKEFINTEAGFEGEIIVSCIGKDGYIGEESLKDLISRVYKLEEINQAYEEFLQKYQHGTHDKWHTAVGYLSILQRDPQLPWELLPTGWAGDKAYELYEKIMNKN